MPKARKLFTPGLFLLKATDYPNNPKALDVKGLELPVTSPKSGKATIINVPALNSSIEELYFYFYVTFASALQKSGSSVAQFVASLASRQYRTDEANDMRTIMSKVIPLSKQIAQAVEAKDFVTAQRLMALAEAEAESEASN